MIVTVFCLIAAWLLWWLVTMILEEVREGIEAEEMEKVRRKYVRNYDE